jgi:hypothetical protein
MKRTSIVVLAICLGIAAYSTGVTATGEGARKNATWRSATNQTTAVTQVLAKAGIWGKDFPSVLAFLESWNRVNEQKIYVFPDRVVGGTRYEKREAAQAAAARLSEAMKATRSKPKPQAADLLRGVPAQAESQLRVEVIQFLPDDDYYHVAWVNPSMRLLTPNVSVASIRNALGAPEKSRVELIQNETERRPVVLTLHSYANGAVVFAESDWSPLPGTVDRVILDVRALTAALY